MDYEDILKKQKSDITLLLQAVPELVGKDRATIKHLYHLYSLACSTMTWKPLTDQGNEFRVWFLKQRKLFS